MIPPGLAPPPTEIDGSTVVAGELCSVHAALRFDLARREAHAEVTAVITVASPGWPAFDLRQSLTRPDLASVDLGGGPGAEMRLLDRMLQPGEEYRLELDYAVGLPAVEDPRPIAWGDGTVAFDIWCSDLAPGRYLEQWIPASLCQDRFPLTVDIELAGAAEAHRVIANGELEGGRVRWPADHTSLSSLLVIAPESALVSATAGVVELTAEAGLGIDAQDQAARAAGWIERYAARLGAYPHGSRFLAHLWSSPRGMEYDGAASASVGALEHEVFHSWFGRGVKPASANDGWIDEAITSWVTGRRLDGVPLALDLAPVVLCPASPWSRFTPREAYSVGAQLFADLAWRTSVDAVMDALAAYFAANAGGFVATAALEAHLADSLGVDVTPWWDRYVRGRRAAS